jgi:hypothetical protein
VALEDYTSQDEVRAALGVDSDELSDATLDLDMYYQYLLVELRSISATLLTDFATVVGIAEGSRSAAQAALFAAVKLFAPYAVAVFVLPSLPLLAQKALTDGKASVTRFSGEPYKDTSERVQAMYEKLRTDLITASGTYLGSSSVSSLRPFLSAVGLAVDPVTGE